MKRETKFILFTVFGFLFYAIISSKYFASLYVHLDGFIDSGIVSYLLTYLVVGIPIFGALLLLYSLRDIPSSVGLEKNLSQGMLVAFVFTLPMLLGYALSFSFNSEITSHSIFVGSIFAAFFEELYFRGFLFGLIFRNTKLGFIPSIFFGAVIFGLGHLHQSTDLMTLIGIFLVTGLGAAFFAWLYVEWNYNLWVPIGLHLFMNLHWSLFSAGDNALGGATANIYRLITIFLAISGTIAYKKSKKMSFEITKRNVWMRAHS